ncbi:MULTISPECIES: sigma-54 interaction domain-containing protein [unclassified Sphingomonas]|uniref:sigma-54 interaction domain-containing protein n=1 Tax=unclassified Sphingomonas TaxID=196159 RepID=UPI0006F39D68|nr:MULTISPECIES: sigma 54-interacting transcriptional regulator [unclassified Sphingomonas]KQX26130.1 Fis family transcriptional regulator [Sphingomonas sp. Root1294]KQY69197.1 Fis family transcriptional regulator [Sphingomonas sp. Root50]KRB89452.1 Fis family transcriptional regulator [Sphingomonas sp. Root720]
MVMIGISEKAQGSQPTLVSWLAGAGIETVLIDPAAAPGRDSRRILHVTEVGLARQHDILIDFADGTPVLRRAKAGRPATIVFGFDDMAFGYALIAELVRPRMMPACGEPESARFLGIAARVARSDATVLLLGETGTGKEGVARYIHAASRRAEKPFVAVNCAALPETMLEAMLFGHQKGAFTGASGSGEGLFRAAEGGTLLLDEIAELPLALQAKLLRALQEREVLPVGATAPVAVDLRIIAAGNRDLAVEVEAGRFRADLYWRLNVMPLALKPLGARRQDIRAIAAALMLRHTPEHEDIAWPTAPALDRLMTHDWPGNVRELENVLQRAMLMRDGARIEAGDLIIDRAPTAPRPALFAVAPAETAIAAPAVAEPTPIRLADAKRISQVRAIEEALAATGGHRLRAAQRLGISERTLRYRMADMRAVA